MRKGEVLNLKRSRINLKERLLRLKKEDTKTHSDRSVPIHPEVRDALDKILKVPSLHSDLVLHRDGKPINEHPREKRGHLSRQVVAPCHLNPEWPEVQSRPRDYAAWLQRAAQPKAPDKLGKHESALQISSVNSQIDTPLLFAPRARNKPARNKLDKFKGPW